MALTESVRLDVVQAEAAVNGLLRDIDSLSSTQTVDVDVAIDDTPFRTIDERLDSIERNVGEVNREVADIAVSAQRSSVEFEQMAQALGVSEDEARQLADEILSADRAARQIDDSARDIARQLGFAEDDADRFANEMARASRETRETDRAMDGVSRSAARVRAAIIGAVAAIGVRGLVRFADDAIESYNTLTESVNAVNVVFEEGADTVLAFGENVARTAGLARGEFQQAVVPIGALLRNFGFEADAAGQAAVNLTQRAADLASVFNADVNEALDAIAAGLRGEANPLERFGAGISAARVEAFALSSGLAQNKADIDDLIRVQARYQLILEDTARVQGDFARTLDDPANAARALAAEAENARAALGEQLIPAYLEILRVTPDVIASFEGIGPAVGTIASAIANASDEIAGFAIGTLDLFARTTVAAQILGTQLETLPTQLLGFATSIPFVREIVDIVADLDDVTAATAERTRRLAGLYAELDLITSIQAGVDPLEALGAAVAAVADDTGVLEDKFDDLARLSGLSGAGLEQALRTFIINADQLELAASQVEFLRFQVELLRDELVFGPGGAEFVSGLGDIEDALAGLPGDVDDGIVSLQELQAAAREAGVGLSEALGSDLFPAGTVFSIFADVEAQVAGFRDRVNEIGRDIDPLEGAVEALEISRDEFVSNLQEAFAQEVGFEANLARLGERGFDALEDKLRELGPGAAGLVEEFLNNAADAAAAEDVLDATGSRFAEGVANSLREEFRGSIFTGLPAELARELALAFETDPGTGFDSLAEKQARALRQGLTTNGRTEMQGAGDELAEESTTAFADRVAELAPEVGFDAALDLARALTTGEAANAATQAGIDWAALFSSAVAANVSFDFQAPGTPTPTRTPSGGTSLGPNVGLPTSSFEFNIVNPIETDLQTSMTQAQQAAQTITTLLGSP